jgi:hypothetical protein
MTRHRILLGLALLAAAILGFFFLAGLADGSVSSFNIGSWAVVLGGVAAAIVGGIVLRRAGRPRLGDAVLAVVAVPVALYLLFFLALILMEPRWN